MTNDLAVRVHQHKTRVVGGFTAKYNVGRLVYFEEYPTAGQAMAREKELKDCRRELKVELIEDTNPAWEDLSVAWYESSRTGQELG